MPLIEILTNLSPSFLLYIWLIPVTTPDFAFFFRGRESQPQTEVVNMGINISFFFPSLHIRGKHGRILMVLLLTCMEDFFPSSAFLTQFTPITMLEATSPLGNLDATTNDFALKNEKKREIEKKTAPLFVRSISGRRPLLPLQCRLAGGWGEETLFLQAPFRFSLSLSSLSSFSFALDVTTGEDDSGIKFTKLFFNFCQI